MAVYEKGGKKLKDWFGIPFWSDTGIISICEVCVAIGYILSATVMHPYQATVEFYSALLLMYAKWCAIISTALTFPDSHKTPFICEPPTICSMIYILNSSSGKQQVKYVLLGSTINGTWGQNTKNILTQVRGPTMESVQKGITHTTPPLGGGG